MRHRSVFRRVNLSEIVRQAGSLVKSSLFKHVALEFDLAADPLFIDADADQMKQLITNLLNNGAEAVPEGEAGHVRITTRQVHVDEEYIRLNVPAMEISPGKYAVLQIADSGAGMDSATQAAIFNPFLLTGFTGRGLGLAAALGIVKGHGGTILVESKESEGTIFKVLLPSPASGITIYPGSGNGII
jgi:two-component system cell cycle sensor histidine kinase/response regulator CckA